MAKKSRKVRMGTSKPRRVFAKLHNQPMPTPTEMERAVMLDIGYTDAQVTDAQAKYGAVKKFNEMLPLVGKVAAGVEAHKVFTELGGKL